MDENNKVLINNHIASIYKKKGFMAKFGGDIFITLILIIVLVLIFMYFYIINNLQSVKANWSLEKCNPFYMPFAGIINNTSKTISNKEYTINNFTDCIQSLSKDIGEYFIDPVYSSVNFISILRQYLGTIFTGIIGVFSAVVTFMKEIFEYLESIMINGSVEMTRIIEKMRDGFSKIIGSATTSMYFVLANVQFTFLWTIWTPVWSVTTTLIPLIISVAWMVLQILFRVIVNAWLIPAETAWSAIPWTWWLATLFAPILTANNVALGFLIAWLVIQLTMIILLSILLSILISFNHRVFRRIKVNGAAPFPL